MDKRKQEHWRVALRDAERAGDIETQALYRILGAYATLPSARARRALHEYVSACLDDGDPHAITPARMQTVNEPKRDSVWCTPEGWMRLTGMGADATRTAIARGDIETRRLGKKKVLLDVQQGLAWIEAHATTDRVVTIRGRRKVTA